MAQFAQLIVARQREVIRWTPQADTTTSDLMKIASVVRRAE